MSLHADNRIAHLEATKPPSFEVGRNPIFDAICAKEAVNLSINTFAGPAPQRDPAAFRQAARSFTGCVVPPDLAARKLAKPPHRALTALIAEPLPAKFDLREFNLVPPVRNQAACGQCWNFSGSAAAEGATLKAKGGDAAAVDWSEQAVVDCGGTGGCNGDWPETTLKILKDRGTCDESQDRYRADSGNGRCPAAKPNRIDDYAYVSKADGVAPTDAIKRAVMAFGVVSCAVAVDDYWAAYRGGVFSNTDNDPGHINHAVNIVGWDDADGCWIVRNSWSEAWGEGGYMRAKYGANLIGFGAIYAVVKGAAPVPVPPVPPVPPAPPKLVLDPITFRTNFLGGTVTIRPTYHYDAPALESDCGCKEPGLGANYFGLFRDVPRLIVDLKAAPVADAVTLGKAALAAVKGKDVAGLIALWPQVQNLVADPAWGPVIADGKAVLGDLGIAI